MRLPNIAVIDVEVVFTKKAIWGFTWWPSTKEMTTSWWKRGKIWLLKTSKKGESVSFANNPLEATLPWKITSLRSTRLAASVKQPFLSPKIWRSAEQSTQHVKSAILMRSSPPSWRDICKAMPRLSQFQSPTSPSNLSSNALFTYVSSFCCPVFGGQCFLSSPLIFFFHCPLHCVQTQVCPNPDIFCLSFSPIGRAQRPLCHDNDHTPCPQFVSELCIRLWTWLLSWHRPSPTLPSTLYWNYVLGYEIRHTDHFCHDIPLTTPTLPPTLYWNYVLCYKWNRLLTLFLSWQRPYPMPPPCIGIMS